MDRDPTTIYGPMGAETPKGYTPGGFTETSPGLYSRPIVMSRKWANNPNSAHEADIAIQGKRCIVCNSPLLIPFLRPPRPDFIIHCNHCGSEILAAVMLNREAWKV